MHGVLHPHPIQAFIAWCLDNEAFSPVTHDKEYLKHKTKLFICTLCPINSSSYCYLTSALLLNLVLSLVICLIVCCSLRRSMLSRSKPFRRPSRMYFPTTRFCSSVKSLLRFASYKKSCKMSDIINHYNIVHNKILHVR